MAGLEPADEGVKVPCLTTWLHPCMREERDRDSSQSLSFLVGWVKGLEPSTPGTTIRCSNQLSYTHHISVSMRGIAEQGFGTPEGIRTPGPRLSRPLLYPAELLAQINKLERVTGIEPASPAWKAGALTIVLHLHSPPNNCQPMNNSMEVSLCQAVFCTFLQGKKERTQHKRTVNSVAASKRSA